MVHSRPFPLLVLLVPILAFVWNDPYTVLWSVAQWLPLRFQQPLQNRAWNHWSDTAEEELIETTSLSIPVIDVQEHLDDPLSYLETTYGRHWRRRPLLLKQLWTQEQLEAENRRLSLSGLLQENLTIPYFTDARRHGALGPDARAPVAEIVAAIVEGAPYKIGSQLVVQSFPILIEEVSPGDYLTRLFGDYFKEERVKGMGPWGMLPALTTVPLFVAGSAEGGDNSTQEQERDKNATSRPYTALHCEPIGNIAVQLNGEKHWTLVDPRYWTMIKPSTAPDGRAFFASWSDDYSRVPTYSVVTGAGDAIWIPTWTWHRVDYNSQITAVAIGASLFHFRVVDFVVNQPLFALLILPALFLELLGYNTQ